MGSNDSTNLIMVLWLYMGKKLYKKLWEIMHYSYKEVVEHLLLIIMIPWFSIELLVKLHLGYVQDGGNVVDTSKSNFEVIDPLEVALGGHMKK